MPVWAEIELEVLAIVVPVLSLIFGALGAALFRLGKQAGRLDDLDARVKAQNDSRKRDHERLLEDHKGLRKEIHDDHQRSFGVLMELREGLAEIRGRLDK